MPDNRGHLFASPVPASPSASTSIGDRVLKRYPLFDRSPTPLARKLFSHYTNHAEFRR